MCSDKYTESLLSPSLLPPSSETLAYSQVERLSQVISEPIDINPKEGNFPTLSISPSQLIKAVRKRLDEKGIDIQDVRLNGSAASYCIAEDIEQVPKLQYNDLDVIFRIRIKTDLDLHIIRDEVLSSLLDFFPEETQTDRISRFMLEEFYVKKMVKVLTSTCRWSLISLGDETGKNIELKFVDAMKRQYEFSIDSFQIVLDPLLSFDDARSGERSPVKLDVDFYPCVQVVSLYGDYRKALDHLNKRLISTKNPEEIRGGGLLKYCYLQVAGYTPDDSDEIKHQEPYMCSRFFIDFPLACTQYNKIHKYIVNRYLHSHQVMKGLEFLERLLQVVNTQARCLMDSERHKTIGVLLHLQSILPWQYGEIRLAHMGGRYVQVRPPYVTPHWQPPPPPPYRTSRRGSDSSSPMIHFPHSANNTVPVGPSPTPVR